MYKVYKVNIIKMSNIFVKHCAVLKIKISKNIEAGAEYVSSSIM